MELGVLDALEEGTELLRSSFISEDLGFSTLERGAAAQELDALQFDDSRFYAILLLFAVIELLLYIIDLLSKFKILHSQFRNSPSSPR